MLSSILELILQPDAAAGRILRRCTGVGIAAAADRSLQLEPLVEIHLHQPLCAVAASALFRADEHAGRDIAAALHRGAAIARAAADREGVEAKPFPDRLERVQPARAAHPGQLRERTRELS